MSKGELKTIVVGADFGSSGDDAIIEGLRLLDGGLVSTLHAVHVLDPADVIEDDEKPALATEEEVLERAPSLLRQRIEQLASLVKLDAPKERIRTHARIGKAVETIHQVAVDYDADLILVGTHGRRGIDRLVLGSVAEKLVRVARCPVLVVRPKDYSGLTKTALPDAPYKAGEAPKYKIPSDRPEHITTERDSWEPSDTGPTGFRIV